MLRLISPFGSQTEFLAHINPKKSENYFSVSSVKQLYIHLKPFRTFCMTICQKFELLLKHPLTIAKINVPCDLLLPSFPDSHLLSFTAPFPVHLCFFLCDIFSFLYTAHFLFLSFFSIGFKSLKSWV